MTGGGRGIRTPLGHPSVRITPIVPDYAERFIRRLRRFTQIHFSWVRQGAKRDPPPNEVRPPASAKREPPAERSEAPPARPKAERPTE